jgi:hypothetical protein
MVREVRECSQPITNPALRRCEKIDFDRDRSESGKL